MKGRKMGNSIKFEIEMKGEKIGFQKSHFESTNKKEFLIFN